MDNKTVIFKALFDANYQPLCLYVGNFVHDSKEVEDIVQNLFLKFWEHMAVKPQAATRAYLYRMAKNALIDRSRLTKVATIDILSVPDQLNAFFQPESDDAAAVDKILAAINSLPERARQIIYEVYIYGKSYKQVSYDMGISVNTIKTQVGRSLKTLRESLAKEDFELFLLLFLPLQ